MAGPRSDFKIYFPIESAARTDRAHCWPDPVSWSDSLLFQRREAMHGGQLRTLERPDGTNGGKDAPGCLH